MRHSEVNSDFLSEAGRPCLVWFAACLVLIAVVLSPIRVEASDQGHLYLENAIRAYTEKADPERAHFYLQLADRRGLTVPGDRADALQLEAYLYLYDSRQQDGMRTLGESLRYEPRAFPLYILGLHALELRQFDRAYRMLADAALLEVPDGPPQSTEMDQTILYQLMPVYCPAETEAADGYRILNATRANQSPYTQPREFSALWRSQLRPTERRLAAYQALLLARILNDEPLDSEFNRLRGIAATNDNDNPNSPVADAGNNPDPANVEDGLTALSDPLSGSMELLKDPLNDTYHRSCIQRLDRAEAFFRRRIQAGSIDEQYPALEYIRGHLKRAHFNRMVATRSPTSIYGYARYLQSRAMWYEALYNYRKALHMLEFDLPPTGKDIDSDNSANNTNQTTNKDFDATLHLYAHLLRGLAATYAGLNDEQNHRTAMLLAVIIEDHLSGSLSYDDMRTTALKRCGENLKNPEALQLLIRDAQHRNDAPKIEYYQTRARNRAEEYQQRELQNAFRY